MLIYHKGSFVYDNLIRYLCVKIELLLVTFDDLIRRDTENRVSQRNGIHPVVGRLSVSRSSFII